MQWLKPIYRWCHRIFWYSLVTVILAIAIGISIIRLYLPDVETHLQEVEHFASALLEQKVFIKSMDARLTGFTPNIIFNDVYLLDQSGTKTILHFEQARLTIDLFRSIYNFKVVPDSFTIYGVSLGIRRNKQGNFVVQGLDIGKLGKQFSDTPVSGDSDELAKWLFERSRLAIKKSTVVWNDVKSGKELKFEDVNFNLLNDENRHQLNGTVSLPPQLGRQLEVAFDFKGNILNPVDWDGKLYVEADDLNLANWGVKPSYQHISLEQGTLSVEMWGHWQRGMMKAVSAHIDTQNIDLFLGQDKEMFRIQQLSGLVNWNYLDSGWKLNLEKFQYQASDKLWPESSFILSYANQEQVFSAYSSYLKIDDIKHALIKGRLLEGKLLESIVKLDPEGELDNVHVKYSSAKDNERYYLAAGFKQITTKPWQGIPGFRRLTGLITLDQDTGVLHLDSQQASVDMPKLFRKPITLLSSKANVSWYKSNNTYHVSSQDIELRSKSISGDIGLYIQIPLAGGSPYIDLQVAYENGVAKDTPDFLPVGIMDKALVNWIDHAFLSGQVTKGGVILNGRLKHFPYYDYSGTLLADFHAQDVQLSYQPGYPDIFVNEADLEISGKHVSVASRHATMYNSRLKNIKVSIDDFRASVLNARGEITGETKDLARFLIESPIAPDAAYIVQQSQISGHSVGQGRLQLPLSAKLNDRISINYSGSINVMDNQFSVWEKQLVLNKINGNIRFNEKGVTSDDINFQVLNEAAKARIFTQTMAKKQQIMLSANGQMDTTQIRHYIKHPIAERFSGRTSWQGILNLGTGKQPGYIQLVSPLNGVTIDLPEPLKKSAATATSLDVKIEFPKQNKLPIYLKYADALGAAVALNLGELQERPLDKGSLVFAFNKKNDTNKIKLGEIKLPLKQQLNVSGSIAEFSLHEWKSLINHNENEDVVGFSSLNLPIHVDMEYLKIISDKSEATEKNKSKDLFPARDPRKMALIQAEIKSLIYDDMNLGHVRVRTQRHVDGLKFSEIYLKSPFMQVHGDGTWLTQNDRQHTNLVVVLESEDLGNMLSQLGYVATIKNGKTKSVIQVHWYDAPTQFSIEKLNGNIGIVIDKGVIQEVNPGAGRLLGLMSLSELPRRLTLDFSEFSSGLTFDQIVGQIEIRDGDAYSDNLSIISPIALIAIKGRTGLAQRDFNQHVSVVPRVTGTIPAISWLAWGGQIGALVFLLEKMVGEQVNTSIADEYTITGSWDAPVITKLAKQPPEQESGAAQEDLFD